jgi:YD repeat-containing protein
LNRLFQKVTPEETTTYTCDAGSRLTQVADATLAYTYDALSRRTALTLANGVTTTDHYDGVNRLLTRQSTICRTPPTPSRNWS